MKCFTISFKNKDTKRYEKEILKEGIRTIPSTNPENDNRLVFLGMKTKKKSEMCKFQMIFIGSGKSMPPIDEDGWVHNIHLEEYENYVKGEIKNNYRLLRHKNKINQNNTEVLVEIDTEYKSNRLIHGHWKSKGGWPTLLYKAWGRIGQVGFRNDVVRMDDQDVLLVTPSGGMRSERVIVRNDCGDLSCIPELEYLKILKELEIESRVLKTQSKSTHDEELSIIDKSSEVVKSDLEITNESGQEKSDNKDGSEIGKAPQVHEVKIYTEQGETIGA